MYSKVVLLCCLLTVYAAPNVYDQSQNGELNVQVDLKDLQIFTLLSGQSEDYYENIDYAYDYSEMTIKPQTGTSKKPLNTTTEITTTQSVLTSNATATNIPATEEIETTSLANDTPITVKSETSILNNTILESNTTSTLQSRKEDGVLTTKAMVATTKTANESDSVTQKPQFLASNISSIKSEVESTTKSVTTVGSNVTTKLTTSNSNCKKGFVLNQKGGCDLKIQSMSNALLKIVKLSQKLKSRRHRINGQGTL